MLVKMFLQGIDLPLTLELPEVPDAIECDDIIYTYVGLEPTTERHVFKKATSLLMLVKANGSRTEPIGHHLRRVQHR